MKGITQKEHDDMIAIVSTFGWEKDMYVDAINKEYEVKEA